MRLHRFPGTHSDPRFIQALIVWPGTMPCLKHGNLMESRACRVAIPPVQQSVFRHPSIVFSLIYARITESPKPFTIQLNPTINTVSPTPNPSALYDMTLFLLRSMMYTIIPSQYGRDYLQNVPYLAWPAPGLVWHVRRRRRFDHALRCVGGFAGYVLAQLPELFPHVLLVAVVNGTAALNSFHDVRQPPRITPLGVLQIPYHVNQGNIVVQSVPPSGHGVIIRSSSRF